MRKRIETVRIITVCFMSIVLFSCSDDSLNNNDENWFGQFEEQWFSTESDYFGIDKGAGIYFFEFENGVVNHYVDNTRLNGIIYTWDYAISDLDGRNYIELLESDCWNSENGGFFEVQPLSNGFSLISTSTRSAYDFEFTTPDFELIFEINPCAEISNEWIENYINTVFRNVKNEPFNKVVFRDGIAYSKAERLPEFVKAYTYQSWAEEGIEYFEVLDICVDYKEDFAISEGVFEVREYNNYDGNGGNGFTIKKGSDEIVYLEVNLDFPEMLDEDCYSN